MMQLFASAAKLRGGGPILQGGFQTMCRRGSPPPRILIGYRQDLDGRLPKLFVFFLLVFRQREE